MTTPVDLPVSWSKAELSAVGQWGSGGTPSRKNQAYYGGSIPWLKIGDLTDGPVDEAEIHITEEGLHASAAKLLPPDTLLLAMYGSIGKLGITKVPCATNQAIAFCKTDQRVIDLKYLFFQLRYLRHHLVSLGQGGTQQNISQTILKRMRIALAPHQEQHRIVEKIETLFARIEKGEEALREVQKLLKRYRQSILKAAVTGELTRDWREANQHKLEPASDLLARILEARRENWEGRGKYKNPATPDSTKLSELPTGWTWATVDQVTTLFKNGLSKKPISEPNALPILRISAVRPMNVSLEDLRYYPLSEHTDIDQFWVERGDLLFTRYSGSAQFVGVCGQLRDDIKVLHPDKLIKARPVSVATLNTDYLELAWNTGWTRKHIAANIKTTSGQQGIAGADIKMAPFPLPPSEEQAVIAERIWEAMERIASLESACQSELARSARLRQSILKSAFTGQLIPQDPNDEPAGELLARIRTEREAAPAKKPPNKKAARKSRAKA